MTDQNDDLRDDPGQEVDMTPPSIGDICYSLEYDNGSVIVPYRLDGQTDDDCFTLTNCITGTTKSFRSRGDFWRSPEDALRVGIVDVLENLADSSQALRNYELPEDLDEVCCLCDFLVGLIAQDGRGPLLLDPSGSETRFSVRGPLTNADIGETIRRRKC